MPVWVWPLELFTDLVATGEFLSHKHTRKHWRSELTVASKVIDRQTYGDWENAGAKSSNDRAHDEVKRLLAKVEDPPLDDDVSRALDEIIGGEESKY